MTPRTWPSLYLAIAISFGVAGVGSSLTDLGPWYQQLAKPDWKPPDAAFGVIWSTIFTLCAFSAWWAWHASSHARQRRSLLALFAANAALNVLWSLIYFQWHRLDWALVELVFLWLSIAALMVHVHRYARASAWMLLPYLVWVSAAGVLNWDTWRLNPQAHAWHPQSNLNAADNPPGANPSASSPLVSSPAVPSAGDAPTAPNAAPRSTRPEPDQNPTRANP
jgi:tryptophan-rich sensory protein